MLVNTFLSRYTNHIFEDVKQELKKKNVILMKDPYYLNKKGEGRFMISADTHQNYQVAIQIIGDMIGQYLNKDKKLITRKNAPKPLNIIL